jgi:flavodoxin
VLSRRHQVKIQKAIETDPQDFIGFDIVIFGSPSWNFGKAKGQPHYSFLQLIERSEVKFKDNKKLAQKKFAVFGLGDSSYTYFCGAVDVLERFIEKIGGKKIIQSLRIDGFYFSLPKNTDLIKNWAEKLFKVINN